MTSGGEVATAQPDLTPPEDCVPVDQRFLGLDKRTIWPALGILVLVIVYSGVLPVINDAVSYRQEAKAGDVIDLGNGTTFTPAVVGASSREP